MAKSTIVIAEAKPVVHIVGGQPTSAELGIAPTQHPGWLPSDVCFEDLVWEDCKAMEPLPAKAIVLGRFYLVVWNTQKPLHHWQWELTHQGDSIAGGTAPHCRAAQECGFAAWKPIRTWVPPREFER